MKRNLVDSRWTHYLDVNYWNDGSPFVKCLYYVQNVRNLIVVIVKHATQMVLTFEDLKQGAFSEYNTQLEEHLKLMNIIY